MQIVVAASLHPAAGVPNQRVALATVTLDPSFADDPDQHLIVCQCQVVQLVVYRYGRCDQYFFESILSVAIAAQESHDIVVQVDLA